MNLRKINAVLSLVISILLLDHVLFNVVWMFSRGRLTKNADALSWILVGVVLLHAALSIAMGILVHKGEEKHNYKTYPRLNAGTMIQRMSGVIMLLMLIIHIVGSVVHYQPKVLFAICDPLFFAVVLAHVAVSCSKALITLGIGNVKLVRVLDKIVPVFCGILFILAVIGYYLCLFKGVVR